VHRPAAHRYSPMLLLMKLRTVIALIVVFTFSASTLPSMRISRSA